MNVIWYIYIIAIMLSLFDTCEFNYSYVSVHLFVIHN